MMNKINKILLTGLFALGTLSTAFAQNYTTNPDTVIVVSKSELEEGVKAVAEAIIAKKNANKQVSKDILSKDNIQLLKYQILLQRLGLNLAPNFEAPIPVRESKTTSNNDELLARIAQLETMIAQLASQNNNNKVNAPIIIPKKDEKDEKVEKAESSQYMVDPSVMNQLIYQIEMLDKENRKLRENLSKKNNESSLVSELRPINPIDTIEIQTIVTDTVTVDNTDLSFLKRDVFFILGGDKLTNDAISTLDKMVEILKKYPDVSIDVIGYASKDGNKDKNLRLSARRADTVASYIVSKGISDKRIYCINGGIEDASINSTARKATVRVHQ